MAAVDTKTDKPSLRRRMRLTLAVLAVLIPGAAVVILFLAFSRKPSPDSSHTQAPVKYRPHPAQLDTGGFITAIDEVPRWKPDATLQEINQLWQRVGYRGVEAVDREAGGPRSKAEKVPLWLKKAMLLNFEGEAKEAYKVLREARSHIEADSGLAVQWLYTLIYYQGVTALRRGENENCIMCRGESSCILPISPAAVHTNRDGSEQAIVHFTEYLAQFPEDLEVRWLLNLSHMTLGGYPQQVDPRYLVSLDHWLKSEFDIGKFRDIGDRTGLNRFNQSGGAIMEDFDNDGLLDIFVSTMDPTESVAFYHNKGDGTFEDRTRAAGLSDQFGGLYCVQTDYNNDGYMDIFIPRGAWYPSPIRPSLLRNNGNGTFTDVTKEAGLLDPANSNAAAWADYDNDGFLDLFVCCELHPNRLYHNRGDGTFEEVAAKAGVQGQPGDFCKGCTWIDYDNDGYPDLFVNNMGGTARLYHNNGDGTFSDVTLRMGIDGPRAGFPCWAFDYDNDGWLDIFAIGYEHSLDAVVRGLQGQPHRCAPSKLYRNLHGLGFQDVTREAGLDMCLAAMGSNFGDFDNDGYLDFYLGTGDPSLAMLIPNRMFKNVAGKRFAEITVPSGTGHLQKGHGVACGDWDRDGNIDIFIQMGGGTRGDRYHNILFQNPGHANHWLTVKLIGKKTNRAAIGARIKAVTAGAAPLTVHRLVSSGSSFGANPLQQTIGLGQATRVATLEITWPTSRTKQVFHDIPADQAIEITEFATAYRQLHWTKIPMPPRAK